MQRKLVFENVKIIQLILDELHKNMKPSLRFFLRTLQTCSGFNKLCPNLVNSSTNISIKWSLKPRGDPVEKVGFGLQGETGPFFKNLSYHSIKSEKQKKLQHTKLCDLKDYSKCKQISK